MITTARIRTKVQNVFQNKLPRSLRQQSGWTVMHRGMQWECSAMIRPKCHSCFLNTALTSSAALPVAVADYTNGTDNARGQKKNSLRGPEFLCSFVFESG